MSFLRGLLARLKGTWCTDCPVCFTFFYGNEAYKVHARLGNQNYRIVCPTCAQKSLQTG